MGSSETLPFHYSLCAKLWERCFTLLSTVVVFNTVYLLQPHLELENDRFSNHEYKQCASRTTSIKGLLKCAPFQVKKALRIRSFTAVDILSISFSVFFRAFD